MAEVVSEILTILLALMLGGFLGYVLARCLGLPSGHRRDGPQTPRERLRRLHAAAQRVLEVVDQLDSEDPKQREMIWQLMADVNRLRERLEFYMDGS